MNKKFLYTIVALLFISCEKEYSVEGTSIGGGNSTGTLQDSGGNCKNIFVSGIYKESTTLNASNYIIANVTFNTIGYYKIYSDTVNGIGFYTEGYAFSTGLKNITINGFGAPFLAVNANFKLRFGNSVCNFQVVYNGGLIVQNANNDYFPTSTLSNWTYYNSSISDTVIINVLATNKTIDGNLYRQFHLYVPFFSAHDTLYYRKDGTGNYYRYYVIGSGPKAEFTFLKDYASVGTTWESPVVVGTLSGNPANVKYKFTLTAKDITATIGGKVIDSIITVKEETQYFELGSYNTKNIFVYSYAKKIGLVDINQLNSIPNISVPIRRWQVY